MLDALPSMSYGDEPKDRLLSELVLAAASGEGKMRYDAIDQIGMLGDARAKDVRTPLCDSDETAVAGVSLVARIRLADTPDADAMLAFLKRMPNADDEAKLAIRFKTNRYRLTALQRDIFTALEQSVKRPQSGSNRRCDEFQSTGQIQKISTFDYVAFFSEALKLPSLQTEENFRNVKVNIALTLSHLAEKRSLPLIHELMNDPDIQVQRAAMTALKRISPEGERPYDQP